MIVRAFREAVPMSAFIKPGQPSLGSGSPAQNNSSTNAAQGWVDDSLSLSPEVQEVCAQRGIAPQVLLAAQLARRAFGPVHELHAEIDVDPDTDERRVVLDVTVDAP